VTRVAVRFSDVSRAGPARAGRASGEELVAYRDAVARVVAGPDGPRLWHRAAAEPDLLVVLDALPGGAEEVLARLEVETLAFRPGPRSNVRTPAEHLRLLLLQQIDVLWWSPAGAFADDAAVLASRDLVGLAGLRASGALGFRYRVSTRSWPVRARNYAVRRWASDREPHTSGLSYDRARPAVVALLDDVARRFAAAVPRWQHGLWVNCLVRSEAVQDHLRELGYSAARASSHCAGPHRGRARPRPRRGAALEGGARGAPAAVVGGLTRRTLTT
jgi:hypothetical protein